MFNESSEWKQTEMNRRCLYMIICIWSFMPTSLVNLYSFQFIILILDKKNWNVNHYQYSEKYQIYIINRTLFLKIHDHKQYLHVKCECYCWIPINILGLIKGKTTRLSFKKISMIFFFIKKTDTQTEIWYI